MRNEESNEREKLIFISHTPLNTNLQYCDIPH